MKYFISTFLFLLYSLSAWGQACIAPNYCAYTGTDIVLPNISLPDLGGLTKNNAIVFDTSYVSHGQPNGNLSRISRCTDQNFTPTNGLGGFGAGQGGAGSGILWNTNSTLIHVLPNTGAATIAIFNPVTMSCSPAITADKNLTHPGLSSQAGKFGTGEFSRIDPDASHSLWWAFGVVGTDVINRTAVTPITISQIDGKYSFGTTAVDFIYGLPIGANAPEWQPSHSYALGAYVSHTMVPGEFSTWAANSSTFALGDIIWPNYPTGCAFVLKKLGMTGSSAPNWSSAANCGSNANAIPDGTATWRTLVGPGKFVFQLTSAGGTSGSSTPAFVPISTKHPDMLSTVSDNGLTWTNTGVNVTVPIWAGLSRVSADDTKFAVSWSTSTYGADPSSLGGSNSACTYANCSGDQGTGVMSIAYDVTSNTYNLFNTATLIQSRITCSGGTGYNCAGGSLVFTALGKVTSVPCPFYLHDSAAFDSGLLINLSVQTSYLGGGCPGSTTPTLWNPYQTFNASTQAIPFLTASSHQAFGFNHLAFVGQDALNYGFTSGAYGLIYPTSNVTVTPSISWQATPCDTVWVPGDSIEPCQLRMDEHLSWAYNPVQDDSTPVCGTFYNNVLANANGPNPVAAYQGEVVCFSTSPTWTNTGSPNPAQKQWRFAHTGATQSNPNFNIWFQIGQLSQDGRYYAFGTDWGGLFGSQTGVAPVLPIPNPAVTCLGGYLWQASHTYTLGTVINPVPSLNGGGSPYHAYQAVAVTTGTSGATAPTWSSTVLGGTLVDSGVTWQDLGPGNCRGEVIVVELSPIPVALGNSIFSGGILVGGTIR